MPRRDSLSDPPPPAPRAPRARFPLFRLGALLGARRTPGPTHGALAAPTAAAPARRRAWFYRLVAGRGAARRGEALRERVAQWSREVAEHTASQDARRRSRGRGAEARGRGRGRRCFLRRCKTVDPNDSGYDADAETVFRSERPPRKGGNGKSRKTSWWGNVWRETKALFDLLYGEEWARIQRRIG